MSTLMLLITKYGPVSSIPATVVFRDQFLMSQNDFMRLLKSGPIATDELKLSDIKRHGVPLIWLSEFIEKRRVLAIRPTNG